MFKTTIIADSSLSASAKSNALTFTAELVPGQSINAEPELAIEVIINDDEDEDARTQMFFKMDLDSARELAGEIQDMMSRANDERIATMSKALEFKSAQLSCAKGSVGSLRITRISDSERAPNTGFGMYALEYFDDSGDNILIHVVDSIELYVPFMEEEQFEWLRALVGGNHQYTASIGISLVGFSFKEVIAEFESRLSTIHPSQFGSV
jgi:hypothetical protein